MSTNILTSTVEICIPEPTNFNKCSNECLYLIGTGKRQKCILFCDTCPNGLRSYKCKQAFQPITFQKEIEQLREE